MSGQRWKEIVGSSLRPERSPGGTRQCDQQLAEPGPENGTRSVSQGSAGPDILLGLLVTLRQPRDVQVCFRPVICSNCASDGRTAGLHAEGDYAASPPRNPETVSS